MDKSFQEEHEKELEIGEVSKKVKKETDAMKSPLIFRIVKKYKRARTSIMTLPHGDVNLPVWMPVGTKGAIKGLTAKQMEDLECRLLLGNTYHLGYKPGGDVLEQVGGLHKFANWKYNLLTDSGGFQMVSLSKLCKITEEGVEFQNPFDGSMMQLKPEDSMRIQNQIGADIMMALDDVVQTTTKGPRMKEACERTTRWIDRCFAAHKRPDEQNLFPIIQGGLDFELRQKSLDDLIQRNANGYAIGGLAGGESKEDFWQIVDYCAPRLPENKPRYLMGVGYPVDLIVCSSLGVDMFDCVFPTRTARFGTALTKHGMIRVTKAEFATDLRPIQEDCGCSTCKAYSRAYLYLTATKEEVACHLISTHNIYYLLNLMKNFRAAVVNETLDDFVNQFIRDYYIREQRVPGWVRRALKKAEINLDAYNDAKDLDEEEEQKLNEQNGGEKGQAVETGKLE